MKLIDIHTHLSSPEFDAGREEYLKRALEVCDSIIDIGAGTSADAIQRAKSLAESHQQIYFTVGVHPHDAETIGQDSQILKEIEALALHPKCVAIGECGLDYYYGHSPQEIQKKVFEWHIALSQKVNLPLMIHTRDAEEDTKKLLQNYSGKAVFHCFTGSQSLADFAISKEFLVSFSGIVTFKNADDLRQVFKSLPVQNIVIETDAPYLAPVPMRGKKNEPSFIQYTAKFLADLKKMPEADFALQTTQNALNFFTKIPQPN